MTELPLASLVICTAGRPKLLHDTIASILEGGVVPREIVVVDQGGDAGPALDGLAREGCDVRVLATTTKGLGRARNLGISAARHPAIVFTDDDVLVETTWFDHLLRALCAAGPRAVVTGRVLPAESAAPGARPVSVKIGEAAEHYSGNIGIDVLFGNNFALFRAAVDEVGAFDERLGRGSRYNAADDNDLGYRLLAAGYSIEYVPDAVLHHRAWRAGRALRQLNWYYGRGQGAFYAKHASLRSTHMLARMVDLLSERVRRTLLRPLRERRLSGHGDVTYAVGAVSGFVEWLVVERLLGGSKRRAVPGRPGQEER